MTRMTIDKWYGRSVRVPDYYHANYQGFLVSCLGIIRSIVEDNIGERISIRFIDSGTACADQENALIYINSNYLRGNFGYSFEKVSSNQAISAILGIVVHEAAHFAWSPVTLKPFAEYVKQYSTCVYSEKLAATLGNIVEDIFIEAEVGRSVPSLSWMLDSMNELVLSDETLHKAVQNAKGILSAPYDMLGVIAILDALLVAKLHDAILSTPYIEELFAEIVSAKEMVYLEDRKQLVLSLYDKIMCNLDEEQIEQDELDLDKFIEKINQITKTGGKPEDTTDAYTKRLNVVIEKMEKDKVTVTYDDNNRYSTMIPTEVFIERVLEQGKPVQMDMRYQRLAEAGLQRAVVNRPYGEQKKRGSHIRGLHRIATDQRIFAEPVSMNGYKPMQVIILVDCSGSMDTWVESDNRINLATRAALGAAYGLVHAHCDVAVYGHTAESLGGTEVEIYKFKGFSEPVSVLSGRLGGLSEDDLRQNRDGYAISYVAKKFLDKRKRQLLIVISDGQPWGSHGYNGEVGIYHTRDQVNAVRRQGIDVLSISITEDARVANDTIYGSKYNVFNEDPNVIEDIIRTIVLK